MSHCIQDRLNDVLIIGAGPTGLVLSCELQRRGIPCRLVDKNTGPFDTSRAFTVHARTMELFNMIGLAESFVKIGSCNRGFEFNFEGKKVKPKIDLSILDSIYPYVLICSQTDTERILREHLETKFNFRPEWSTEAIELDVGENAVNRVTLRNTVNGSEEVISPKWVIGCDGAQSFVRKAMGIDFVGSKYAGMLMQLMDVKVEGFGGRDDYINYYVSRGSLILLTKLPNGNHRVIVSTKREDVDADISDKQFFQQIVDLHMESVTLHEPDWCSKWVVRKQLAEKYKVGNVILVGDAVHIHSPAGGQGMNVGIQDAFNLGWKLSFVIKGLAHAELLETYERERKPVGMQVIEGADALHNVIMAHGKGMRDRLEITQAPGWHEHAANRISGLSYNYCDVSEVPDGLAFPEGLQKGDRVPNIDVGISGGLHEVMRHPNMTLVVVIGRLTADGMADVVQKEFSSRFSRVMEIVVVNWQDNVVKEAGGSASGELWLVRPDGYFALRCSLDAWSAAVEHLEATFVL